MSTDGAAEPQSSGEPAISVRGVGKRYDIYTRNRDRLADLITLSHKRARPFWALRDVSFDLARGEAVGIVGRNGSGKSTLMQIIAGTLSPTEGEVHVRGRIAALLELGSGFNPHFTGRENVFLAGSILGFSRRQMEQKFDAIAAFAEIGEFLEQPVEVYSSGMHARLAFSVAAMVEPEILILDEILSVGDAGFQQKCIGRLRRLLDSGVTLLFVSHAADAVKSICGKGLFLKAGRQEYFGEAVDAVDRYVRFVREGNTQRALAGRPQLAEAKPAPSDAAPSGEDDEATGADGYGTGHGTIEAVRVLDTDGSPREGFAFGTTIVVEATVRAVVDLDRLDVILFVRDKSGIQIFAASAWDGGVRLREMRAGERALVRFSFENALRPGPYGVCMTFGRRPDARGEGMITLEHQDGCATFRALAPMRGVVRGKVQWPVAVAAEVAAVAPTSRR